MVAFICTESGTDFRKVFFFSWFPCGTEGGTDCWMVAFICTESGTDFWKGVFLFVVPVWHLRWYRLLDGGFYWHLKVVRIIGRCFSVVPVWH